jgi:hypothetical protein
MNPEIITKAVKAVVPLVALAGYELQPEQVDGIITVAALVLTGVYSLETLWKGRRK